ncbi:MAG: winged helix DNA-binding domain-containing protein [Chloroflexi bacterium]|nr:MAG: winged helix DNA-binding domain-containing protein [Chloroflexota bacterium]
MRIKEPPAAAELSWADVHSFRLARHHLLERAPKARLTQVVGDIGGAQAQVMSTAELQIAVRVDCTVEDVREALWKKKSLVKTWLMRGTLHLIPSKDLPMFAAAMGAHGLRNLNAWLKYLQVNEAQLTKLFDSIDGALNGSPMTREELIAAVGRDQPEPVLRILRSGWGGVLKPAARRGQLCFGPNRGQSVTFVRPQAWLGTWKEMDPEKATVAAAERYLSAYGPATKQDFTRWWGAWLGVGTAAWKALDEKVVTVSVEGQKAQMLGEDLKRLRKNSQRPSVQLLPGFDPYLMGHATRDHLFDKIHRWKVSRVAGWISPVVLVDGRVLGVWSHTVAKQKVRVELKPFASLPARVVKAAGERAETIAGALGAKLEKFSVA